MSKKALLVSMRDPGDEMLKDELQCFQRHAGRPIEWSQWNVVESHTLPHKLNQQYDVVTFGGAGDFSFTEPINWMQSVSEFVCKQVTASQPMFCSCMGIQLLAYAYAGKVVKDAAGGEVGTYAITLTSQGEKDPIFKNLPKNFTAQQGHVDKVDNFGTLDFIHLACNPQIKYQAIKLKNKPIYATQFHAELDNAANYARFDRYRYRYEDAGDMSGYERIKMRFKDDDASQGLLRWYLEDLWR